MATVRYTQEHEYLRIVEDDEAIVGITAYAQQQLGDIVYVGLPDIGADLEQGDEAGVVESVKAASEVYAPVSGEVTAINDVLADKPETVNADPAGEGWFFRIRMTRPEEVESLLDETAYDALIKELS